ncbi:MAG: AMP-binding protein [Gammaproteobacteria bacterium]|nr:AMP-binding protein [Gammaproteobacteria bacterium]
MRPEDTDCSLLHHILALQAGLRPDAPALWWQDTPISFAQLYRRVSQLSHALAGIGTAGDRIGLLSWNCPEFIELMYAVPAAGRVLVPLNARLAPAEWADQLQRTDCQWLFGDAALLQRLRDADCPAAAVRMIPLDSHYHDWLQAAQQRTPAPVDPEDIAWILFTSGSTGKPKGAMLSHRGFMAGLRSAAHARPVAPGDRFYYPFPLFHVAAHNVLLQHRYGACVVLPRGFDAAETIHACHRLGVTSMSLAPTMLAMLLDHPDFSPAVLSSVRSIGYGASAMPVSLLQRLLSTTDVGLCQSYGMTELCGSVAFLTAQDHQLALQKSALLQSVGHVLPTARVRLVDDNGADCPPGVAGEITVQAAQQFSGYWGDEAASAQALRDGWLHTGDIGRFDSAGYLYIVDRKKDMIISGGENVASREVEEVLRTHPAVRDCAVIGLPDARWGETVAAVIVAQAATDNASLEKHCRARLGAYKTPRHWFQASALPLNAAGKVDKPLLRQRYATQ